MEFKYGVMENEPTITAPITTIEVINFFYNEKEAQIEKCNAVISNFNSLFFSGDLKISVSRFIRDFDKLSNQLYFPIY